MARTRVLTGSLENCRATRGHGFGAIGARERRDARLPERHIPERAGVPA